MRYRQVRPTTGNVRFLPAITLLAIFVGLNVGAHSSSKTHGVAEYNASFLHARATNLHARAATRRAADNSLFSAQVAAVPAGWANQDIGAPALAGSASEEAGVFTITAAGTDIWNAADQFHLVYQPLTGDGSITARVDSLALAYAWAKAGVMMRESLDAGSRHAYALVSAERGVAFQRRPTSGGTSVHTPGADARAPYWVRLLRQGSMFVAYESPDGQTWKEIGSQSIAMAATVYVGLAVTSHNTTALTTASISGVTVETGPVNRPPIAMITTPASGSTLGGPANITVDATASDPDGTVSSVEFFANGTSIGSVSAAPYSLEWNSVPAGTYTLTAVATDNAGASATSAPVTVTVTEVAGPLPAPWASQDIGAPALAGNASATSTGFIVEAAGADIWESSDQFHFVYQTLTGDGEIVARVDSLAPTHVWAKAGVMIRESLAAGSRHALALVSADRGVRFQRRTTTGGLSLSTSGALVRVPYWVRLVRTGSTIEAYEAQNGSDWTLIGRETLALPVTAYVGLAVTSHNTGARTTATFSGVAVRGTSPTNQPPTTSVTSPLSGATFTAPATITITADASDADGTIASVGFYAGPMLIGSDATSPYSITWSNVGTGSYSLTAVATDDGGAATTSGAASITVNPPANQPPSVTLTSPVSGFNFGAPATIALAANAVDADGSIARVEFYAGTTLLGTDTASPYSLAWNVLSPGGYTITAVAVDNSGARTTSAAVSVTARPSQAAFTASADHNTLVTSYRLEIFVAGTDPNTATPVAVQDLGKPAPVNGDITVDITTTLRPLAAGNYIATVSAVGAGGAARSAPAALVR